MRTWAGNRRITAPMNAGPEISGERLGYEEPPG